MKKNNFSFVMFWVFIITLINRFLGLFRDVLIGFVYGTSSDADVIFFSLSFPNIIQVVLTTVIVTVLIPVYLQVKSKNDGSADRLFRQWNKILILTSIVIYLLSLIIIIGVYACFSASEYNISEYLIYIASFLSIILFIPCSQLIIAKLNANKRFIIPAISNFIINAVAVIMFTLIPRAPVLFIILGVIVGPAFQFLFLFKFSKDFSSSTQSEPITIDFKDINKSVLKRSLPIAVGVFLIQANFLIDKILAGILGSGYISALNYGYKLNLVIFGLVSLSISSIIYPKLTECFISKQFDNIIEKGISLILHLTIPIMIVYIFFSYDILKLIFSYGNFTKQSLKITQSAMVFYSISIPFNAIRDFLNKAYFASGDTKTPMSISSIGVLINLVMSISLLFPMGHNGIALASSIGIIVVSILLFFKLSYKFNFKVFFGYMKKTLLSVCIIILLFIVISTLFRHEDLYMFRIFTVFVTGILYIFSSRKLFQKLGGLI